MNASRLARAGVGDLGCCLYDRQRAAGGWITVQKLAVTLWPGNGFDRRRLRV
jgi:hypothetical protein